MAGVTIHLRLEDGAPTGDVLTISGGHGAGESFINLTISGSLSLIPAGRDHEAVASARALAAALTDAANTLEAALIAKADGAAVSA